MATPDAPRPLLALSARVAVAAAALPDGERTALVLRDRDREPYARVAEVVAVAVDEVPELLVQARLAVREAVRDVDAPPLRTPHCTEARRRLTVRQDGEVLDAADAAWLEDHLDGCDACRLARRALREGALAAQAWDGVLPDGAGPGTTVLDEEDFAGGLPEFVPGPPAPGRERAEARAAPQRSRPRMVGMVAAGAIAAAVAAVAVVVVNGEPSSSAVRRSVPAPAPTVQPVQASREQRLTQQERLDRRRAAARRAARREALRLAPLHARRRREAQALEAARAQRRARAAQRRLARREAGARATPAPALVRTPRPTPTATPKPKPVATATPTPVPVTTPQATVTPQATATPAPTTPAVTATPAPG